MRKFLKAIYIVIVCFCLFLFWFSLNHKPDLKPKSIPKFNFKDFYNDNINQSNLDPNKQKLIIYLNPECDYCSIEIENLIHWENKDQYQILLVFQTDTDKKTLNHFIEKYHLLEFESIQVLLDGDDQFPIQFYEDKVPCSFLFDTNNKLVRKKKGLIDVEIFCKTEKQS
ncbi:hypothetical protein [Marinifilum sp. D714]|uniref:hypothetical protein n=1 Tax=Marinifilum sp. D714 TaxID=2937523 RepID=UPI0027BD0EF5|nr:hypothetical protein [Marinifilum sp. D714]MDQ2180759.1 hypothetical protein [Marinifilum sp. D714]